MFCLCLFRMCPFQLHFCTKSCPQYSHLNLRSLLWIRMCSLSALFNENALEQTSHLNLRNFVCFTEWFARSDAEKKVLSHSPHSCRLSNKWYFLTCLLIATWVVNRLSHALQTNEGKVTPCDSCKCFCFESMLPNFSLQNPHLYNFILSWTDLSWTALLVIVSKTLAQKAHPKTPVLWPRECRDKPAWFTKPVSHIWHTKFL